MVSVYSHTKPAACPGLQTSLEQFGSVWAAAQREHQGLAKLKKFFREMGLGRQKVRSERFPASLLRGAFAGGLGGGDMQPSPENGDRRQESGPG